MDTTTTYDPNGAAPNNKTMTAQINDYTNQNLFPQFGAGLDATGQSLLTKQVNAAKTTSNDVPALMNGVGSNGSQGILKNAGGGTDPDLQAAIQNRSNNALANTVNRIKTSAELNSPIRLAQRQATAAASEAENEQLRFNSWQLENNLNLQSAQMQAAQKAENSKNLSDLLGLTGKVFSTVLGGGGGG